MTDLCRFLVDAGIATPDSIRGHSQADIAAAEGRLSVRFPTAMNACFRRIGGQAGGLFEGNDFGLDALDDAIETADDLTGQPHSPWRLPEGALPFLQHQGYVFVFIDTEAGDDPPVWHYTETEPEAKRQSVSFTAWLREVAIDTVEAGPRNDELCREIGQHRTNWTTRKKILDRYADEVEAFRKTLIARVVETDRKRGQITGPVEFQQLWNREFPKQPICKKLRSETKRIPWGWTAPGEA